MKNNVFEGNYLSLAAKLTELNDKKAEYIDKKNELVT